MNAAIGASPATEAPAPEKLRVVPSRHPLRWLSAVVLLLIAAALANDVITNPTLHWDVVGHYQFSAVILKGLLVTIELTVLCLGIGIVLGTLLAVMRLSGNPVLTWASWIYIWLFRGTPVLVQLIFWYNLALLFPVLGLGIPFTTIGLHVQTNQVINGFSAAILGLGLNEAAYMAEIVRAGILAVDRGQTEAALALGLTESQAMRGIVLPQAMRVIVPPTGNQFINLLKATSLVAFIAGGDLMSNAEAIYSGNFQVIPLLIVASLWYLVVTSLATVAQHVLERRIGQGFGHGGGGAAPGGGVPTDRDGALPAGAHAP